MKKWTNVSGQTKPANERSFVYRPPAWRRWRNVKTTYLFRNVMNYRNLGKIVWTQFYCIRENYLKNSELNCSTAQIPLTNRVRGPYCKLRTEVFPLDLTRGGKTRIRNVQYGPKKDIYYISGDFVFYRSSQMERLRITDTCQSRNTWDVVRTLEKLVNHSLSARDLQAFLVFSQHPAWVITPVNP